MYRKCIERDSSFFSRLMSNMFNKKEPNKNVNKISTLAYGEYSTINLSPGFYEIQYKVSRTGYSIIMEKPTGSF